MKSQLQATKSNAKNKPTPPLSPNHLAVGENLAISRVGKAGPSLARSAPARKPSQWRARTAAGVAKNAPGRLCPALRASGYLGERSGSLGGDVAPGSR